jgi:hypothetical protein
MQFERAQSGRPWILDAERICPRHSGARSDLWSYEQLDGVADRFAKFFLGGSIDAGGLEKLPSAFRPHVRAKNEGNRGKSGQVALVSAAPKFAIPSPTPRKSSKKLTIGMATYDDYDGVCFTPQALRLYHPEILYDTEFLVIDNHPDGPCGQHLKNFENAIPSYRYVPKAEKSGTAVRDCIFEEAGGDCVLCMDCHVGLEVLGHRRGVEPQLAKSNEMISHPVLPAKRKA